MANEETFRQGTDENFEVRLNALPTIIFGGLAIGVLDFIDASIFFPLYYGITFIDVWHGPASGVLGREAARVGGLNTALFGIFLHFVVAFCVAAVYYLMGRYLVDVKRPVIFGLLFGIVANLVMQNVVKPLSAIGPQTTIEPFGSVLNSFIGHALLVGLPVAMIAKWFAIRSDPQHRT